MAAELSGLVYHSTACTPQDASMHPARVASMLGTWFSYVKLLLPSYTQPDPDVALYMLGIANKALHFCITQAWIHVANELLNSLVQPPCGVPFGHLYGNIYTTATICCVSHAALRWGMPSVHAVPPH